MTDIIAGRIALSTFAGIIAGGGFSGAELCGALQDFIARALRLYPTIDSSEIRMVLALATAQVKVG